MVERTLIAGPDVITYEGLIDIEKLYTFIDRWFDEHQYDKHEVKNEEITTPDGLQVYIGYRPTLDLTENVTIEFYFDIEAKGLKPVTVEVKGKVFNVYKGVLSIKMRLWLMTDTEKQWEKTPLYYFFRTLIDRVFFRVYISKYKERGLKDYNAIKNEIKAFFNMHRFIQ